MEVIRARLRRIREQWQLSLREVEERSLRFAEESGNQSYRVSASWLNRLEREQHELTVNKLIVLAHIYCVTPEQLLRSIHPGSPETIFLKPLSNPDETILFTEGLREERATYSLSEMPAHDVLPDETTLLPAENGALKSPYRRGIIGKRDRTMDPMLPPGVMVLIDSQERAISTRKSWMHEFQRPIYFLRTRDAYICGWCELDKDSEWLTSIPHPLSSATSRRWRYRIEIESIGRVVFVAIPLAS